MKAWKIPIILLVVLAEIVFFLIPLSEGTYPAWISSNVIIVDAIAVLILLTAVAIF